MKAITPELARAVKDLRSAEESKDLLLATISEAGKPPSVALRLIRLVETLRSGTASGRVPAEKKELLEHFLDLLKQNDREWVCRICCILYEKGLAMEKSPSSLPEAMIRDLLEWVKREKSERVREILWAVLFRKDLGADACAGVEDVAAALCESDPMTRNNAVRFLFDHFTPESVIESLVRFSAASGRRVPGIVFRRYLGLIEEPGSLLRKKETLEKILHCADLGKGDVQELFSEALGGYSRFDLVRLQASLHGLLPAKVKGKRGQLDLPFAYREPASTQQHVFSRRISLLTGCNRG